MSSIGYTVSLDKCDSALNIESESRKVMDISSTINVPEVIETPTFDISSGIFYSGAKTWIFLFLQ